MREDEKAVTKATTEIEHLKKVLRKAKKKYTSKIIRVIGIQKWAI